ncbi:hypothetical protein ACF0H5_004777 [Mactra antiquata]
MLIPLSDAGMNMHSNGIYERGVAFSARLTDNSSVQSRNNLIFTDVLTNIGQAYDPESGVFKCPFYGRYLFSLKIRAPDYKQVSVEILAKSHVIATLTAGDTNVDKSTASVTVVVSLHEGDEVMMQETKPCTRHCLGDGFVTFTGILL